MTKLVRNPIDVKVGSNVKARRAAAGVSQTELADHLGITFQQVQKYESGANRISASRLYLISGFLGFEVQDLFDGVDDLDKASDAVAPGAKEASKVSDFMGTPAGVKLVQGFLEIACPKVQKRVRDLIGSVGMSAKAA